MPDDRRYHARPDNSVEIPPLGGRFIHLADLLRRRVESLDRGVKAGKDRQCVVGTCPRQVVLGQTLPGDVDDV